MTAPATWQTDDCCPACGELLRARTEADGALTHECGCGWSVTWAADREVVSLRQAITGLQPRLEAARAARPAGGREAGDRR